MKRLWIMLLGTCALGGAVFTSGCGPGLIAAGGGSVGAIFGLQSGSKKKKDDPPPSTGNVAPVVIVTNLEREESPSTIEYTIIDANNDDCTIEVEFSVGGGAFQPCFENGGDGTTNLGSSAGGLSHVFGWDFAADLGPDVTQDLTIRVRANDGQVTGAWGVLSNQSIGNEAPVISNVVPTGTDIVLLTFTLTDKNSDLADIEVAYSTDQGQNFTPVDTNPASQTYELIGNPPSGLLTSPTGAAAQFIWDSSVALPDLVDDVIIRLRAKDQPPGYNSPTFGSHVVVGPFPIDNSSNNPPELSLQTSFDGQTYVGQVQINFTLRDDESDATVVNVEYSTDGGQNFANARLLNQVAPGVAGPFLTNTSTTPYQIVWDALADFGAAITESDVVLRLQPEDSQLGEFIDTDSFTVIGNEAPQVLNTQVLQDSGNVPLVITVFDHNSHPVSLEIDYTTDINAATVVWTPLDASDFVFGDPDNIVSSPFGADNALVWDTNIAFPNTNEPTVVLRITPTDDPLNGTAAAQLSGVTFFTSAFPIINDPGGSLPVSIDIFTTDNTGTPLANDAVTVAPGGVVYLDRVINPSTAVYDTFWRISQTDADYGTLVDPNTAGSLQYGTGQITVAAPGSINDGDTFTVDDGLSGPRVFEFDLNGLVSGGNVTVDISTAASADDVGVALATAINQSSSVRITATHTGGGVVDLVHEIASRLGNEEIADPGRGNATAMAFSAAGTVNLQMDGGDGTGWVRYNAPATPPAGTDFVTLVCVIDHPSFFTSVTKAYRLYWGDAPGSVTVTAPSGEALVGSQVQFTATVEPLNPPQIVEWSVIGGSANGTINQNGLYTAPATVPVNPDVVIRATSVDPNVSGTETITVVPYPTGVQVIPPQDSSPEWVAPDLLLGETIQFTADVTPQEAPDGVNWRIIWNGNDQGSGNSTVGNVDSAGNYTAPSTLPSPDTVRIEAVSQVLPSVFGGYTVKLNAPPPTSFEVSPSVATVYAGGAGQQFTVGNFVPSNANTAVTWEMNPAAGPSTGSIDQSGFYTPPSASSNSQVITITARSTVAQAVSDDAIVNLEPNAASMPTDVIITPGEGITISAAQSSQPIQFSAVVAPQTASQEVEWVFVGQGFGSLGLITGLYTPNATAVDRVVTIRARSVANPTVTDEVQVCITGDGQSWVEEPNAVLGRGDASTLWDSFNDRLWIIGGRSETATSIHELTPLWIDYGSSQAEIGSYAPIGGGAPAFIQPPNVVVGAFDDTRNVIYALIGQGSSGSVKLMELDATQADPTSGPPADWTSVLYGGAGNAPVLAGSASYHCWWEPAEQELQVLVGNHTVHRFDGNPSSVSYRTWLTPFNIQNTSQGPSNPQITAHAFDAANGKHYFVGAENASAGAATKVWRSDGRNWQWQVLNSQVGGSIPPASGLVNPSMYFDQGKLYLFGGRPVSQFAHSDGVYNIVLSANNATWTPYTYTDERPLPRGNAAFALAGQNGAYLFGGELPGRGVFGDLWAFDDNNGVFEPFNPENIRPQGRLHAAGAYLASTGLTYGGSCDFGVSNETWLVDHNAAKAGGEWTKVHASGDLPPPLWGAASCYDPDEDLFVMFGGDKGIRGGTADTINKVWTFDESSETWVELNVGGTAPTPRRQASLCYDPTNQFIWMYGGADGTNTFTDVWYIDVSGGYPGTWNQATVTTSSPDPRVNATIGFDTRLDRLLMIGGDSTVSGPNSQLFAFNLTAGTPFEGAWQALSISNTGNHLPVNRSAAFYDDECRRFVHAPSSAKRFQGVVLGSNGPTWQYMTAAPLENHAMGATGLYDPATGRYYAVFGERTIQSRAIGTNVFRTIQLK